MEPSRLPRATGLAVLMADEEELYHKLSPLSILNKGD